MGAGLHFAVSRSLGVRDSREKLEAIYPPHPFRSLSRARVPIPRSTERRKSVSYVSHQLEGGMEEEREGEGEDCLVGK